MDLSKVLGEVYNPEVQDSPPPPYSESRDPDPVGPEWADDALLDQAFASWVPGPPADAPAAEREMAHLEAPAPVDDELSVTLPVADDWPSSDELVADVPTPPALGWTRSNDDVLPAGGRQRRGFSLRRG